MEVTVCSDIVGRGSGGFDDRCRARGVMIGSLLPTLIS